MGQTNSMNTVSKELLNKKKSFRQGLFTSMIIFFLAGIAGFFILTGYRLRLILHSPFLFMSMILLTVSSFYMASFSRRLAITTNDAINFYELKTITLEYFKKFFLRFGLPFNIIIGYFYLYFRYNYLLIILASFWVCLFLMILSERRILFMKFDQQ